MGTPTIPSELTPRELAATPPGPSGSAGPAPSAAPYAGPFFVVTDASAGVYAEMSFAKRAKLGYLRSGSRVPVLPGTTRGDDCTRGWYRLRDGGFVCANAGTVNQSSPEARFSIRAPDLSSVLPYTYARNSKNGTPLYKSVPTVEQMNEYEPYLVKKHDDVGTDQKKDPKSAVTPAAPSKTEEAALPFSKEAMEAARHRPPATAAPAEEHAEGAGSTAVRSPAAADPAPASPESPDGGGVDKAWWQREDADKRLHEVKLDELSADADAILAKRMVKGFYVAVDREFNWNGRPWYKTTKGLVAPADRFWVTQGPEFKGVELDGERLALPIGWTYGFQKVRGKYTLDAATQKLTPSGSLESKGVVALTGKETTVGGKKYVETKDGAWVLATQLRITTPGPPPADIGPTERWIDVNLTTETLVAFEGTRPVFATLISSGKESKIKDKDHRTPTGDYRIREKHVTTTMDGDGSAAGDLPYSIEDVPFVMYFHRSYALHGAFWHSNYGVQMSHGCVNLAPLDAKWVFLFTEPRLPEGWHGVWSTTAHPGSRVVVHE
ncbi:MAG TPA: L,D-transpeptidase family protein [Polyangiaceae bacterium]